MDEFTRKRTAALIGRDAKRSGLAVALTHATDDFVSKWAEVADAIETTEAGDVQDLHDARDEAVRLLTSIGFVRVDE